MKNLKQIRIKGLLILFTLSTLLTTTLITSSFASNTDSAKSEKVVFPQGTIITMKAFDDRYVSAGPDGTDMLKNNAFIVTDSAKFFVSTKDGEMRLRSVIQKPPYYKFLDFKGKGRHIIQSNINRANSISFRFFQVKEGSNKDKYYVRTKLGGRYFYLSAHTKEKQLDNPLYSAPRKNDGSLFTIEVIPQN